MSSRGLVFNIQRFSIHDGPGIRTTVFLKGCTMGCFWCHNPEGQASQLELLYSAERCIACGECATVCPAGAHTLVDGVHEFRRDRCVVSGKCVTVCCSGALELSGQPMSVDEVMEEVRRDRPFYLTSGGGVTLSGGEPTLAGPFVRDILQACKRDSLHTALETCGYCPWESLEALLPWTDLVMMDLKAMTPDLHRSATGNSNAPILENARRLARTNTPVVFRTPVVPTVNDSPEEFGKIAGFVSSLMQERRTNGTPDEHRAAISFELLAFHRMASDKYRRLSLTYQAAGLEPPPRDRMSELVKIARASGVEAQLR